MAQPADFEAILTALDAAGVEFGVIGGLALVAHGGARATVDVDLAYSRETRNLESVTRSRSCAIGRAGAACWSRSRAYRGGLNALSAPVAYFFSRRS